MTTLTLAPAPTGLRILASGSRLDGATPTQRAQVATVVRRALLDATAGHPGRHTLVHGDARGVDLIADAIARHEGWRTERHPADWPRRGRGAGPARNTEMVALGADLALFFPAGPSPGTRGCLDLWVRRYPDPARRRVIDLTDLLNPARHRATEPQEQQ